MRKLVTFGLFFGLLISGFAFSNETILLPLIPERKSERKSEVRFLDDRLNTIVLRPDNSVRFSSRFTSLTVQDLIQKLELLDRMDTKEPIYLILDTPGGSIEDGLYLINRIKGLRRTVHSIAHVAISMGFQTFQSLGDRLLLGSSGSLMSHKASGGMRGEFPGQLTNRLSFWLSRMKTLNRQVVRRSKGKLTLAAYENLIENEFWCEGQDCINKGLADRVIYARCSDEFLGVPVQRIPLARRQVNNKDYTLSALYDACPINIYGKNWELSENGVAVNKVPTAFKSWINKTLRHMIHSPMLTGHNSSEKKKKGALR